MNRETALQKIRTTSVWDMVVIGGGSTGLGIALEACTRGYKTLLLEQADFAKSTSSKSTKLLHGGVRYLAQGEIRLVKEATRERGLLFRNAPHLVKNLKFIIPVYSNFDKVKYLAGLKIYDWISGSLSLGSSILLSREEVLEYLPGVKEKNLKGGILYHDGQFDDARLAITLAQTIFEHDGCAINYLQVKDLLKTGGKISGLLATDLESGESFVIHSKVVVNATGVFADDLLRMAEPKSVKTIAVSQGVHIILDKKFLPGPNALMIPGTTDGRVLFVLPWHQKLIVGTTDTPVNEISLEPKPTEEEINFILENAGAYLTLTPTRKDILSVFAGLRPLAAPKNGQKRSKEISRSHRIVISPAGLFTMLGGKWTTYRKMGEDMVNEVEKSLSWQKTKSTTAEILLFKTEDFPTSQDEYLSEYLDLKRADVIAAVNDEMALHLEDILSRRHRALFKDAAATIAICEDVARLAARLRGKDEDWVQQEIASFRQIAQQYLVA